MKPQYKFYPTLIDEFQYYLDNEVDEKKLLDKINRVPFVSEAAEKGKAFNEVLDIWIKEKESHSFQDIARTDFLIKENGFSVELFNTLTERLYGAVPQHFCKRQIETKYGLVEHYGFIDYVLFTKAIDVKTTKSYELGKYKDSWQRVIYPWCLIGEGLFVEEFEFLVTDFEHVYSEPYPVPEPFALNGAVKDMSERFIEYLESRRDRITDKKIFAQEMYKV